MMSFLMAAATAHGVAPDPVYGWRDGAVYEVTARPGRVTDIALQPGEVLSPVGGVAAGDTVRWIIGDSESGTGPGRQVHLLAKPTTSDIATNLVIATDRRTYHIELTSRVRGYMASVSWRYPETELIALRGPAPAPSAAGLAAPAPASRAADPDLTKLNFGYRIEGRAAFRPLRVFDDGRRTVIDFAPEIAAAEMPPLFILGEDGAPELVNYRVVGRRMVVDRLFKAAELRLGGGRRQAVIRLVREEKAPAR